GSLYRICVSRNSTWDVGRRKQNASESILIQPVVSCPLSNRRRSDETFHGSLDEGCGSEHSRLMGKEVGPRLQ
uniref:Uncharacterized protein n=1 Tax=Parascaris univalens TaxID=6257 RepID=A0A915B7K6_PARUN